MSTKSEQKRYRIYSGSAPIAGQDAVGGNYSPPRFSGYRLGTDSFTGTDNLRWKSDIENGNNATTDASGTRVLSQGMSAQLYAWGYTNVTDVPANARSVSIWADPLGTTFTSSLTGSSEEASNSIEARTKFSNRVSKVYTQFEGGTFLGELRETLHMIKKPGQALREGVGHYLDVVQKNGRRIKRRPRTYRESWLSRTWLEASFGWAPLLNDLDDARQYLKRRQAVLLREVHPVSAIQQSPPVLRAESPGQVVATIGTLRYSVRTIDTYIHILSGGVRSQAFGQGLINASAMGLSSRNFAPTLWEILPWSFAFDYFANIGDVIEGWSNQNCVLSWGRETTVSVRSRDLIGQGGINTVARPKGTIFIPGTLRTTRRDFTRRPISVPPVPGFQFKIPGFGLKWLNLAALARSRSSIQNLRLWD